MIHCLQMILLLLNRKKPIFCHSFADRVIAHQLTLLLNQLLHEWKSADRTQWRPGFRNYLPRLILNQWPLLFQLLPLLQCHSSIERSYLWLWEQHSQSLVFQLELSWLGCWGLGFSKSASFQLTWAFCSLVFWSLDFCRSGLFLQLELL